MQSKMRCLAAGLVTLVAAALPATAAPRESAQWANVTSNGQFGATFNEVRRYSSTSTYPVTRVRISATLTRLSPTTFASEARIYATAPNGTTFVLRPFVQTSFTQLTVTDQVVLLNNPVPSVEGEWTFRFFEFIDDGGEAVLDSRWTDIRITFDDQLPTLPVSFEDLGLFNLGRQQTEFEFYPVTVDGVKWFRFSTAEDFRSDEFEYFDVTTEGSLSTDPAPTTAADTQIAIYNRYGAIVGQSDDATPNVPYSTVSFGLGSGLSGGEGQSGSRLPAGDYMLAVSNYFTEFFPRFAVTTDYIDSGTWNVQFRTGRLNITPPPAVVDLGSIGIGGLISGSQAITPGQVRWFRFRVLDGVNFDDSTYLDIATVGSELGFRDDTVIGLYRAAGRFIVADDDGYAGFAGPSLLSFGVGSAIPEASAGQDGPLSPGEYYLAVTTPEATFGSNFNATSNGLASGTVRVTIKSGVGIQPPPVPPAVVTDLGFIQQEYTLTSGTLQPGEVDWYTFTIPRDVEVTSRDIVDIYTYESSYLKPDFTTDDDSQIGLYTATGDLISSDDDGFGGNSAEALLSFGSSIPRLAPPTALGQDGRLAAGTYYLAVGAYSTYFADFGFFAGSSSTRSGFYRLAIHAFPFFSCATITGQPEGGRFFLGRDMQLEVVASGDGPITYRWSRDGVPMIDGGRVSGAFTPTLTITDVDYADAATYTVRVIGPTCGDSVSTPAVVTVALCGADFNDDGFVDFFDFNDFVDCFDGVVCPPGRTSDYNGDGFTDFFDANDFVADFDTGC
jgi:hypothetical protein